MRAGWREEEGGLSLDPGEWAGELLDATPLPAPPAVDAAANPPSPSEQQAGVTRVGRGEPWVVTSVVDRATVAAAHAEAVSLLADGRLRTSGHGQPAAIRSDKVGFLPLQPEGEEGCPPALAKCFAALVGLASVEGIERAVTGGSGARLLLPPVGMLA